MGNYTPTSNNRPDLNEMLSEAEEDHFLDCPNADPLTRLGSAVLDTIFLFLLLTAFQRVFGTLFWGPANDGTSSGHLLFYSFRTAFQAVIVYYFQIWSLVRFGGSPAKLIFGLRLVDAATGKKPTFPQVLLREIVGKWIAVPLSFGVSIALTLIRPDRLTFQDIISRTLVKKIRH